MKIKGKERDFRFSFSAIRKLEKIWGCKSIQEVCKKMFEIVDTKNIGTDDLLDLMKAGLSKYDLSESDIIDFIDGYGINLRPLLDDMIVSMAESIPDQKEGKKKT